MILDERLDVGVLLSMLVYLLLLLVVVVVATVVRMSRFFDVGNICQILKKFNPTCNIKQNTYRILAVQDEVFLLVVLYIFFRAFLYYWILDSEVRGCLLTLKDEMENYLRLKLDGTSV